MIKPEFQPSLEKGVKYFVEGLAVAAAAMVIPKRRMKTEEILAIALTAAGTFAVLDMYSPKIAKAARFGTGFAIGSGQV